MQLPVFHLRFLYSDWQTKYTGQFVILLLVPIDKCQSQWPSGPRQRSAADRLLGMRVRIPLGEWTFVLGVLKSKRQKSKCRIIQKKK